jgi:3-isopropylmalate dehydrogenase
MLLDWLGNRHARSDLTKAACAIEEAVDAVLADPSKRTADLGGKTGTRAFGAAVLAQLEKSAERLVKTA